MTISAEEKEFRSQETQILAALQRGQIITQEDARVFFGCWRLSARIYRLRHKWLGDTRNADGSWNLIETTTIKKGRKRFAGYVWVGQLSL